MKRFAMLLSLLLVVGLLVAACGGRSTPAAAPNEVQMDGSDFLQSSVTIKAGEAVHFTDLARGGLHIICAGEQGQCSDDPNAPADLRGDGFQIDAGQSHDVTFTQPGTYKVTCSIHPDMNVTITVQ